MDLSLDDEVKDRRDREPRPEEREKLLIENQQVSFSDPTPGGGEGEAEWKGAATGSNLEDVIAFCFELVPQPVGALGLAVLGQDLATRCCETTGKCCHERPFPGMAPLVTERWGPQTYPRRSLISR